MVGLLLIYPLQDLKDFTQNPNFVFVCICLCRNELYILLVNCKAVSTQFVRWHVFAYGKSCLKMSFAMGFIDNCLSFYFVLRMIKYGLFLTSYTFLLSRQYFYDFCFYLKFEKGLYLNQSTILSLFMKNTKYIKLTRGMNNLYVNCIIKLDWWVEGYHRRSLCLGRIFEIWKLKTYLGQPKERQRIDLFCIVYIKR